MLTDIPDEKHAVIVVGTNPFKEIAHLVGAGKARFIDEVEMFLFRCIWVRAAGEESLQSSGMDSCLIQLPRGARGGGESLNLVALRFSSGADHRKGRCLARAGESLDSLNAIRRAQNTFDHGLLGTVEMLVLVGEGDGLRT